MILIKQHIYDHHTVAIQKCSQEDKKPFPLDATFRAHLLPPPVLGASHMHWAYPRPAINFLKLRKFNESFLK